MGQILCALLGVTKEKRSQMELLLALNREQTEILHAEDVDALQGQIDRKQEVMEQVDALDQQAARLLTALLLEHGIANLDDLVDSAIAAEISAAQAATREIAGQAMVVDRQNTELSELLLGKLRQQLDGLSRSSNASRAYTQTSIDRGPTSVYMSRKV